MTAIAGLICAAYGVVGGVILAAYDEFGKQSLLDLSPLVTADATPVKRLPAEELQDRTALPDPAGGDRFTEQLQNRAALPDRAGGDRSTPTASASSEPPALPHRQSPPPATASLDAGQASMVDALAFTKRLAMAPPDTEPAPAIGAPGRQDSATRKAPPDTGADARPDPASVASSVELPPSRPAATQPAVPAMDRLGVEEPVAATLEKLPPDLRAAAPPAFSEEVPSAGPAATRPPAPALKPLDAVPTVVAQAVPPSQQVTSAPTSRLGARPPLPSLKPVVMPGEPRPGWADEQDTRQVAAARPSLPDALRTFWTNLKVMLAAGPAPRVIRARSDGGDFGDSRRADRTSGSDGDGGGSRSSGSSSTDGGSSSGNGGGSSSGNGGGSSGKGGGSSGGTSAGSGGNAGGSNGGASTGGSGNGGGGNGDGGNGGGKGNGKGGGKGDGGKGGGKGKGGGGGKGKGGGDDDDDDDDDDD